MKQQLKALGDMLIASSSSDNEKHASGGKSSSSEGTKTHTEESMKKEEIHTNEKRVQAKDNTSYFAMLKVGKCKSHEDLTTLKTDEVFIWLHQVCNNKNGDFSIKKLYELSIKLKQPGGTEYIKSKIKRYLKRLPNHCSADDKYGQKIRKKLPNYIVTNLKKFFDQLEKNSVDIPSLVYIIKQDKNYMKTKSLRSILKTWVETIPMKQQDQIAKKSIYNLFLDRIQQLLLDHPKNRDAFKELLKSNIDEIAQQIPLDDAVKNKNILLENIVQDLVEKVAAFYKHVEKSGLNVIITESIHNILANEKSSKKRNIEPFSDEQKLMHSNQRSEQKKKENEEPKLKEYFDALSSCVHKWLSQFQECLPRINSFRNNAVDALVREITLTLDTFKSDPTKNLAKESKLPGSDHLKSLICKWVSTFATKDTAKIQQGVSELVDKINQVPFPVSYPQTSTQSAVNRSYFFNKKLSYEIFNWYNQLSSGFQVQKGHNFPNKLVEKLVKIVDSDSVEESIDREINSWASKVLKDVPTRELTDLKTRIINIIKSRTVMMKNSSHTSLGSSQTYFKTFDTDFKVQNQILEWIQGLSFNVDNFGRNTIKSLACDIEARRRHLELNPSQKGTEEEEIEILKFVVFKRLDSVDAKDTNKLIANIPQLMKRLNKLHQRTHGNSPRFSSAESYTVISNPPNSKNNVQGKTKEKRDIVSNTDESCQVVSQTKVDEKSGILRNTNKTRQGENKSLTVARQIQVNNKTVNFCTSDQNQQIEITSEAVTSQVQANEKRKPANCNVTEINFKNIERNQVALTREQPCSSQENIAKTDIDNTEHDYFYFYETKNSNESNSPKKRRTVWKINQSTDCKSYKTSVVTAPLAEIRTNIRSDSRSIIADFPEEKNLAKIYEYFDEVFKKHCDDLPFDDMTPEQKIFAIESKGKVYKGIWKIYLRLKSDPSIESDYSLFADILKDELNNLLQFLPKSEPIEAFKLLWINNVIKDVMNLLKYVHSLAGIISYREILAEKFDRKFIKQYNRYLRNKIQYIYIAKTIDIYILFMRYKQSDRKRANVYKRRFIARLEELVDHVQYELGSNIDKRQFCKDIFKALNGVPLPEPNKLEQEAEEALIRDEIEIWYNELPVFPVESELDNVLRNGEREELAKVLHIIENELWPDTENIRKKMIEEVVWFLQVDAHLNPEYEGHINLLAEDLVRRLQSRSHRVLDENAVEQSFNQSLNNTTLYPNSTYQTVMPALVHQKINIQHTPSNEQRKTKDSNFVSSESYNIYSKSFHTAEESDSNISERNKNCREVVNAEVKSLAKRILPNPEIVNIRRNTTVRSDDKMSMQRATLVQDKNTPAFQTELIFDDKTNLYKPRCDKARRCRQ